MECNNCGLRYDIIVVFLERGKPKEVNPDYCKYCPMCKKEVKKIK